MAIAFRLSGTSFWADTGFVGDVQLVNAFVGGVVQYWALPNVFVGGGAGIGVFSAPFEDSTSETGFAINGRAGFEFNQSSTSGFHAAIELTPTFYDGVRITSIGFQIGWQHY